MSFGKNLTLYREKNKLTQKELVEKSGVAITQLRRYETDKASPSLNVVKKLASTLGVSIDELAFDKFTSGAVGKITDKDLLKQFEIVSTLDDEEKEAIKIVIESIIVKHNFEKTVNPKTKSAWSQTFKEITNRLSKGVEDYSQDDIDLVIDQAVASVRSREHVTN